MNQSFWDGCVCVIIYLGVPYDAVAVLCPRRVWKMKFRAERPADEACSYRGRVCSNAFVGGVVIFRY